MKNANLTEQMNAMQRMFLPTAPAADMMRANAASFWESQENILDSLENFASGWFERRHAGTHQALEAAQRICSAENPVEAIREYQAWMSGAFSRAMADGMACQHYVANSMGAFTRAAASQARDKEAESVHSHIKTARPKAA